LHLTPKNFGGAGIPISAAELERRFAEVVAVSFLNLVVLKLILSVVVFIIIRMLPEQMNHNVLQCWACL
jgi:hypothetical protein